MINKLTRAVGLLLEDVRVLREDVKAIPTPKEVAALVKIPAPKDGISPDVEAIVQEVLAKIPAPKDGISPDVEAIVQEVIAQIPTPKDGKPGRDAKPPLLADVAALVFAQIPKPKDGISPDPKELAAQAAKLIPKPKDGVSPDPKAVAALVRIPTPKQGKPGRDGKSITDVKLDRNILSVWIDGVKKVVGRIEMPQVPQVQASFGGGSITPPPLPLSVVSVSANYAAKAGEIVLVDTSAGDVQIDLPSLHVTVKKITSDINKVVLYSAATIDGLDGMEIRYGNTAVSLVEHSGEWFII